MAERKARVKNIKDTTSNWTSTNPILLSGEIGFEIKTNGQLAMKVGDGVTSWNALPYITKTIEEITNLYNTLQSQIDNIVVAASGSGDVTSEVVQARVDSDGVNHNTLKDRLDTNFGSFKNAFIGGNENITALSVETICGGDFNNLPNNRIYGVGLGQDVTNCPNKTGTVLTYGKTQNRTNSDIQIFIKDGGTVYTRIYWNSKWTNWILLINKSYIDNREVFYMFGTNSNINDSTVSSICNNDFNNLPNNRIYGVGITSADVANAPEKLGNIVTYGKSGSRTSGDVQVFTSEAGNVYHRIYWGTAWKPWSGESSNIRVLALGDSICYGARNSNKGFIGDAGVLYDNIGISGATLSTKVTDKVNIPQQLVNYTATNQPDAIISNGGVNDYYFSAPLGEIPTVAVKNQSEANALDRSTVLGGLQFLFWTMINKFPKAQRFFLCTHKTTARASNTSSTVVDWTVTANSKGYTQTQLFDAIKTVCSLYNVTVIDVFGQSVINTAYGAYVSDVSYSTDNTVTNTEFVDSDGIHPLAYGYIHGYTPFVKKALDKVSKK